MLDDDIVREVTEVQEQEGKLSITLLLGLLNQPLYLRSIAQTSNYRGNSEYIVDAGIKSNTLDGPGLPVAVQQSDPEVAATNVVMNTATTVGDAQPDEACIVVESANPSTSGTHVEDGMQNVLHNLPQTDMRLLCSFLAKEGLSDNAYGSVAEIMKKLAAFTTTHSHFFITELASSVHKLTKSAMEELHMFNETENSLLQSTSSGASILKVLQALSSLVASLNGKEKDKRALLEKEHYSSVVLSLVRDINGALEPLWLELSSCLSKLESVDLNSSSQ